MRIKNLDVSMRISLLVITFLILIVWSCGNEKKPAEKISKPVEPEVRTIGYSRTAEYPHDINAFTEGLFFHEGKLYESTGASPGMPTTRSLFGIVDTTTGKIEVKVELDREKYFGEGITILDGKIYQLTYKTKIGFVYDAKTFKQLGSFTFPSDEGWGLTTDGKNLIMSDGTNTLTFIDPNTLQVVQTMLVSENGYAKDYLNELEYVDGFIYANVWTTNTIVKINVSNGKVVGKLDLWELAEEAKKLSPGSLEMNGIAYDKSTKSFVITGKMWPKMYGITPIETSTPVQ